MYNLNQLKDLASRENAVSSAHDQTYTVGKQDAKCGHLGTTFAVFICLSSKAFAGWQDFVFQTIVCLLFFDFNGFGGKMISQD